MASLSVVNDVINLAELAEKPVNSSIYSLCKIDPVTKTAAFTVSDQYDVYIVNGAANVTVTLPDATKNNNSGRVLHFKNLSGTYTLISGSSDVVPITGGVATTSILPGTAGRSATLVCNGTNWVSIRGITPAP